ncbi:hypothetical protein F5Y17DRAFT_15687 [Xylariaceae sp. FL0594]|nr:hypothetical protein F5Y17DRAFT_15687 [Xylariaceae sp. FL0594]
MAGKKTKVPDAWDDEDWETKADRAAAAAAATTRPEDRDEEGEEEEKASAPLTKAERLAQHAESNRRLWESAETPPEPFYLLASRPEPPLTTEFKPAVKVLSRKPAPKTVTKRDPLTGAVSQLRLGGNDDWDSDDERSASTPQLTPEEIRAKQQREREEKQRRYEEVRAKIFGTASGGSGSGNASSASSGTSTPGNATPPRSNEGRGPRGRGRGRGGGGGGGGGGHRHHDSRPDNSRPGSSHSTPAGGRDLYDPNYSPRPSSFMDRRGGGGTPVMGRSAPREEDQVIRAPRGPESNSRGFARRGAKGL